MCMHTDTVKNEVGEIKSETMRVTYNNLIMPLGGFQ